MPNPLLADTLKRPCSPPHGGGCEAYERTGREADPTAAEERALEGKRPGGYRPAGRPKNLLEGADSRREETSGAESFSWAFTGTRARSTAREEKAPRGDQLFGRKKTLEVREKPRSVTGMKQARRGFGGSKPARA
jgi:hypothetical protein